MRGHKKTQESVKDQQSTTQGFNTLLPLGLLWVLFEIWVNQKGWWVSTASPMHMEALEGINSNRDRLKEVEKERRKHVCYQIKIRTY